ncbi:hypothetical protein TcasGA2_TC031863 [Tribolium castaneum]|uniref:Uncharacterized protein n=1 Tax=Tribolium castaneum TaxID=7070 RepID=A0A139W975_TRICA|nr:hypothetical protein TcasGA2_TC031863 [Tribolium castaneum]
MDDVILEELTEDTSSSSSEDNTDSDASSLEEINLAIQVFTAPNRAKIPRIENYVC